MLKGVIEFMEHSAWAITPDWLDRIHSIVGRKIHGMEINAGAVAEMDYSHAAMVIDGKATIPIKGPIFKKANLMTKFSGATSLELAGRDFKAAIKDPSVNEIILHIDSPGGTVDGTKEFADLVFASRGTKEITAYIDGQGTSAAYWIASAADRIVVSSETVMVGSVGVISAHYDYSKYDDEEGVKRTYIYKGKYKGIANDADPLSQEGKQYVQQRIDGLHGIFLESIAKGRNISVDEAIKMTDESKVFNGKEALERGLVDEIKALDDVLHKETGTINNETGKKEVKTMTLEELKAGHPGLVQLVEAEARQGYVSASELNDVKKEKEAISEQFAEVRIVCDKQAAKIKECEKTIVCYEETMNKSLVSAIKKDILTASDIPENLHSKVGGMVDYRAFLGEDNALDKDGFTAAFDAEVKDWESRLSGTSGAAGDGEGKKDEPFGDKAEHADENEKVLANI